MKQGDFLIKEGEEGMEFYVVRSGQFSVNFANFVCVRMCDFAKCECMCV